jgi:hypothetical protein
MALPIKANDTQEGCNPIASNCVIWQGPDIPCIKLCKGDTISDVTAKLAERLCTILEYTDVSVYDLTCFNPVCPSPKDFQDLIQLLIDRICALNNIPVTPGGGVGCPDCIVPVAQCLQRPDALGNVTTQLQLRDYVILIGNEICSITTTLVSIDSRITSLESAVTNIENNCCNGGGSGDLTMPASQCLGTGDGTPIIDYLLVLDSAFCNLQTTSGNQNDVNTALSYICIEGTDTLPIGTGTWNSVPGWINAPVNLAQAVQDLWLVVCQQNDAITALNTTVQDLESLLAVCCNAGTSCDAINLIAFGFYEIAGPPAGHHLVISFNQALSNLPAGWDFCPTGSTYTITPSNIDPNNPLPPYSIIGGSCASGSAIPNAIRYGCPWRTIYFTGPNADPAALAADALFALYFDVTIQACLVRDTETCTVFIQLPTIQGEGGSTTPQMSLGGTDENPTITGTIYSSGAPGDHDGITTWTIYLRLGDNNGPIVGSHTFTSCTKDLPLSFTFNSGILPNQSYGMTLDIFQNSFARTGIQSTNNVVTPAVAP